MVGQIVGKRAVVNFRLYAPRFQQRLNFGTEIDRTIIGMNIVKRFYSQPIPSDEQLFSALIPNRKCKHPAQVVNATLPMLFVEMQDSFGIAMCFVNVTFALELAPKISVVVDLTVVGDVE